MKGSKPLRLFYVDDDPAARERVHDMAKMLLNPVIVCATGDELIQGLDDLCSSPLYAGCAVIFVETVMNRVTRAGVIEKLRQNDHDHLKDVPMIIVTGSKDDASIARAEADGADAYIVKPFTLDAMMTALRQVGDYRAHIRDMRGHPGSAETTLSA